MFESAQDLIAVLVGLVVLWFLFGALINQERLWQERLWRDHKSVPRKRQRLAGPSRGGRASSR